MKEEELVMWMHVDAIKFKVVAKPNPKDVTHPIFINVDLDYDD